MIELTRLNGNPLIVNSDLVKWIDAAPDTRLTLLSGEKVVVREAPGAVLGKIRHYRAELLAEAMGLCPVDLHETCLCEAQAGSTALQVAGVDGETATIASEPREASRGEEQ